MTVYWFYVLGSVALDIAANIFLEKSKGFSHKRFGLAAVGFIMAAFALLALSVKGLPLFIAYATWGALSISGTAIATWLLFGHTLNYLSSFGLAVLIGSIIAMQWASTAPHGHVKQGRLVANAFAGYAIIVSIKGTQATNF